MAYMGSGATIATAQIDYPLMLARRQHELEARAAAGRKDWLRVAEEAEAGLKLYPGDSDKAAEWVAVLMRRGGRRMLTRSWRSR